MDKWEYLTCFLRADAKHQEDELKKRFPNIEFHRHTPLALIQPLNALGAEGWELIGTPMPVRTSADDTVFVSTAGSTYTNVFLCAFRRRVLA